MYYLANTSLFIYSNALIGIDLNNIFFMRMWYKNYDMTHVMSTKTM